MQLIHYLQSNIIAFYIVVSALGMVVGSFLNVVIYRLPIMMHKAWRKECCEFLEVDEDKDVDEQHYSLVFPNSQCPKCQHKIRAWENIPLISYLFLRGRCSSCHTSISIRYPVIEILSGVLSLIIAWKFGFSLALIPALFLTWALIALSFIDIDHQLLPDDITLPFLWLGLLCNVFAIYTDIYSSVIGAVAGYMSLWLVYISFKIVTGKEGMGHGDFKLLALLGAWMGWQVLPVIIILSSLCGAIIGVSMILFGGHDRKQAIPFGPYLAMAGWIAFIWGQEITNAYSLWMLSP
ncbi:MAG: prepilin peptidase [Gammaproteobacteria bacterium]|nr:prepilin peptidase [Gammaproteobacteria bacterium]